MKATFIVSVLALTARLVYAAIPPACLLHAVNTQDDPTNMSGICNSSNATDIQAALQNMCSGSALSVAQSAFVASCSVAGIKVASYTPTSTASSATRTGSAGSYVYTTAVYNSSCSCTQTVVTSATGGVTSASASRTGSSASGTAVSTAGAVHAQQKMGGYAAAAIALVGAVAAL